MRCRNQPTYVNEWVTDDEDSLQHVAVKGGRKVKSDVPRTELQTFCDIKIAAGVKYLGLHISTVNA